MTVVASKPSAASDASAPRAKSEPEVRSRRRAVLRGLLPSAAAFALLATLYSVYSLANQAHARTTGFDLGIFVQAVQGYAAGTGPLSALKGPDYSVLGDHFSPVLAVLAVPYLIAPSVSVLLIAQAVLIALGVVPLMRWTDAALGRLPSVFIAAVYGLSFGVAFALKFDFHEVAFAVPLVSASVCALGRRRLGAAAAWAAPLVLVKEDLGITVAVIGVLIAFAGGRRLGVLLAGGGVAATVAEVLVLIPFFSSSHHYDYGGQFSAAHMSLLQSAAAEPMLKIATLVVTFGMTLFVSVRSRLAWIVLPTLLWRFVGTNPAYWTPAFHYSLILMPVLCAAMIDVLVRWRARGGRFAVASRWVLIGAAAVAALTFLAGPLGGAAGPFAGMLRGSFWAADPRTAAMDEAVSRIPSGASVSASNHLVPQLVPRSTVSLFGLHPLSLTDPDYVVVDLRDAEPTPVAPDERAVLVKQAQQTGYRTVFARDGYIVLKRAG